MLLPHCAIDIAVRSALSLGDLKLLVYAAVSLKLLVYAALSLKLLVYAALSCIAGGVSAASCHWERTNI
jgi:hypothetical protein